MRADERPGDPIRPRETCRSALEFGGLPDVDLKAAGEEEDSIEKGKYDDGADVQGEGEVVELEDAEEECAARRVAADPGAPTAEEVEEHEVDHLPYRCWCEACVRGRGTGDQHRTGPESRVPVISFDYLLVTKAGVKLRGEAQPGEVCSKSWS